MSTFTRRAFMKAISIAPAAFAASASAQNVVITFSVKNQSAYTRSLEFWDLANNSHAVFSNMAPNESRQLSLLTVNGKDGRMKYRTLPNQPWYERDYIKAGDVISITG